MMHRKLLVVIVATAILALAGCGSTGALSRAELVKQATVICKHRSARIAVEMKRTKDLLTLERRVLPDVSRSVADLSALKPPDSVKDRYARFVAAEQTFLANGRRTIAGRHVQENPTLGHERDRIIRELGLTACT